MITCWSRQLIGNQHRMFGCHRVLLAGEWQMKRATALDKLEPAICPRCFALLKIAQKRARIRLEQVVERRIAACFGPAAEGVDPFRS